MQEKIDDRLSWLTQHLGGTGDKLALVTTCLLHAGYFLLATLCILFLNAPLFTRLVLLVIVPINAWSEIHFHSSLSYSSLSCLLTFALLGKLPEVHMSCSLLIFPPLNSLSNQVITSLPVVPFFPPFAEEIQRRLGRGEADCSQSKPRVFSTHSVTVVRT